MNFEILILIFISALNLCTVQSFLFPSGTDLTNWNDLKITWGINPFDSNSFVSLPRTEREARSLGWIKEKDCSEVNGNRYILNGDRAAMLIFNAKGVIAGIASAVPKGLPFNYPSNKIQKFFNDEGSFYSISAYFVDPDSVCSVQKSEKQVTGDRLVIRSNTFQVGAELKENQLNSFWTKGECFYTMGVHYWANTFGVELLSNVDPDEFAPVFLLYNKGKLNGFGFAFNANLDSTRFEHPPNSVLGRFFKNEPLFFKDPTKSGILSTMHVYLDSTPQFNLC